MAAVHFYRLINNFIYLIYVNSRGSLTGLLHTVKTIVLYIACHRFKKITIYSPKQCNIHPTINLYKIPNCLQYAIPDTKRNQSSLA